jgi:hypothetical protein
MNEALVKSLSDLIDETLAEIEGLKKSRMEAEEMTIGDSKANGSLSGSEVEKADDEEGEEDEDSEEDEDEDEMEKGVNDEAEMKKADEECAKAEKAWKDAMKKRDSMAKKDEEKEDKEDEKEKEKESEEKMEKSIKARVAPLEAKMDEMMKAIAAIAKSPVPSRGVSFKDVQPLAKSNATDVQPLVKSVVLDKLIDLRKSGSSVTSEDVLRAELGTQSDVEMIANKYGIK